jgi:hypothetical protein
VRAGGQRSGSSDQLRVSARSSRLPAALVMAPVSQPAVSPCFLRMRSSISCETRYLAMARPTMRVSMSGRVASKLRTTWPETSVARSGSSTMGRGAAVSLTTTRTRGVAHASSRYTGHASFMM